MVLLILLFTNKTLLMERRVELNKDIANTEGGILNMPKIRFLEDGQKLLIEIGIHSSEIPKPTDDSSTTKDTYVDIIEEGGVYSNGLAVTVTKNPDDKTSVMQISVVINSRKVPGGGG